MASVTRRALSGAAVCAGRAGGVEVSGLFFVPGVRATVSIEHCGAAKSMPDNCPHIAPTSSAAPPFAGAAILASAKSGVRVHAIHGLEHAAEL